MHWMMLISWLFWTTQIQTYQRTTQICTLLSKDLVLVEEFQISMLIGANLVQSFNYSYIYVCACARARACVCVCVCFAR